MEQKNYVIVEFPNSPDGPLKIHLSRKTIITDDGFGTIPSTYPVTIVPARYQGTYEGGTWACFPVDPDVLGKGQWRDWEGSDIECVEWWARAARDGWPAGLGATPNLAYQNLIERAAEKAGINLQDWVAEPTWDKDELKRREGGS